MTETGGEPIGDSTATVTNDPARYPRGIWGAVLLPVTDKQTIDWNALDEELHILCGSTLHGIYTNGTAGEFHNQTDSEYHTLTTRVSQSAHSAGKPFQLGISHPNPRITRQRLVQAVDLQPSGIQFTLPDWWCLSDRELMVFAQGIQASAGTVPLILYNPPHAKHQLSLEAIAKLRDVMPNLVGAKLPGGDEHWYAKRRRLLPGFSIFVAGHTVAFGRPLGADGAYSNVACLSPSGAIRHWQLAQSDPASAMELETRIQKFMKENLLSLVKERALSNCALDKLMAAAGAWGPVRETLLWPYESATPDEVSAIGAIARERIPELFE